MWTTTITLEYYVKLNVDKSLNNKGFGIDFT